MNIYEHILYIIIYVYMFIYFYIYIYSYMKNFLSGDFYSIRCNFLFIEKQNRCFYLTLSLALCFISKIYLSKLEKCSYHILFV